MHSSGQPADDLRHGFLPRKFAEKLLDVLNLERALLEIVLGDVVFHAGYLSDCCFCEILAHVSRSDTVRLKTSAPARESGSTQK